MLYVNLGCGSRYHPAWINYDISASGPEIIAHDLRYGIPLPGGNCDVVYHSHVLEHLRRAEALRFMRECFRVLKPGGILRVAVPDLEQICLRYLEKLESVLAHQANSVDDYDWMMLELYDQTVREQPGGEMRAFLGHRPLRNESFVYERIGEEARTIIDHKEQKSLPAKRDWARLENALRYRIRSLLDSLAKQALTLTRGEQSRRALEIGTFRLAGEVHQWMYDRFSLSRLMTVVGFKDPVQKSATESQIAGWASFNLDTLADGTVVKPDSLFMEAVKPCP
ncbi:MAG: hypothetical protein QOF72_2944 [Blastocatellia bacterium]|nr:hypothetical protein [Blastocatellia bacterium]